MHVSKRETSASCLLGDSDAEGLAGGAHNRGGKEMRQQLSKLYFQALTQQELGRFLMGRGNVSWELRSRSLNRLLATGHPSDPAPTLPLIPSSPGQPWRG